MVREYILKELLVTFFSIEGWDVMREHPPASTLRYAVYGQARLCERRGFIRDAKYVSWVSAIRTCPSGRGFGWRWLSVRWIG